MAIGSAIMAGVSSIGSMLGGSAAASGVAGSAMSWLGGSTGLLSNAGMIGGGMSLLSGISNLFGGSDYAKAAKKAQEEQWRQQMINVREQYRQLGEQQAYAAKQYHAEALNNQVSILQKQEAVKLMAGATGTQGSSITSMLNDIAGEGGRNQAQIIDNYANEQLSFTNAANAIRTGGQMQMREFKKPSAMGSMVSTLGNVAQSYLVGSKTGKALSEAYFDSRKFASGLGSR